MGPFNPSDTFFYWDEPYKWLGSFPIKWVKKKKREYLNISFIKIFVGQVLQD